jgi:P-type E1-E2 ATPase
MVDTIVFDKTGTLTYGKPILLNFDKFNDQEKLLIASIASKSAHILCESIIKNYKYSILDLEIKEVKGKGVYAKYKNNEIWLGNKSWCNVDNDTNEDDYLEVWFKKNSNAAKRLIFKDELRYEAKQVIKSLQLRYDLFLLSGDKNHNVKKIAEELNIKNYFGEKNYQEKYNFVQELSKYGKKVLMVGDGLNDSLALKASYASISPKTSIAISQDASDAIYNGNLKSLVVIFKSSKLSVNLIKQNFTLSIIYNSIAIPLAVMGKVNPIIAAIFMSISSITVILNSLRFAVKKTSLEKSNY